MDLKEKRYGCGCHPGRRSTADAIEPAVIAASSWRRVQSHDSKTPIFIAPNGTIFQTIQQIRQFFFVMAGITFCLDHFAEQLEKLSIIRVGSESQVNEIHLDLIRKYQPDFNEIGNALVPKHNISEAKTAVSVSHHIGK